VEAPRTCSSRNCKGKAVAGYQLTPSSLPTPVTAVFELCEKHEVFYANEGIHPTYRLDQAPARGIRQDGKRISVLGRPRLTDEELSARVRAAIAEHHPYSAAALHKLLRGEGYAVDVKRVTAEWRAQRLPNRQDVRQPTT
jgi:hypothetical protein